MSQDTPADVTDRTATPTDQTASESTEESADSPAQSVSRRALLKGTASAAVGITGLSAVSGTAAAGSWGDCDYRAPAAPGWFGHVDFTGYTPVTQNVPWGTNQITIYIHGFLGKKPGARADGHEVWRKLRDMGYQGDVISCIWVAGSSAVDFVTAEGNAEGTGSTLADWLIDIGCVQNNGIEVNLVCHSLGARLGLFCLKRLQARGFYINQVHFLGGAVGDVEVGNHAHDIVWGCNWLHNWHSENDPVLENIYNPAQYYDAVGWRGMVSGTVPGNYSDHDHSTEIHQHCEYMDYNAGVIDSLYYTL